MADNIPLPRFLLPLPDVDLSWYILFAFTPSFHSPQRAFEADQSPPLRIGWAGRRTAQLLVHVLPAVDGDVGTRYECRLVGTEVRNQCGDFAGLAQSPDGNFRKDF